MTWSVLLVVQTNTRQTEARDPSHTIDEFFAVLDQHVNHIPLCELKRQLEDLRIEIEDVRPYVRFGRERYQRNLMHAGPAYRALILCWRHAQRSPIHDHRGSNCAVRVLQGVTTETLFDRSRMD